MIDATVGRKGVASATVRFGSAVVSASVPQRMELRRHVSSGQRALERAATKITRAGVSLSTAKSVPLYHADPQDPAQLVRDLNGKVSRGVFVGGKFKVLSKP